MYVWLSMEESFEVFNAIYWYTEVFIILKIDVPLLTVTPAAAANLLKTIIKFVAIWRICIHVGVKPFDMYLLYIFYHALMGS